MPNALKTRQFEFLHSIVTPTACNLIEVVSHTRRGFGYTVKHLHCPFRRAIRDALLFIRARGIALTSPT